MKNVYPSDELCHLWANAAQPSARNANSSMSFEGGTLYSYRTAIAAKLGGFVLLSDTTYTPTTSKHQTYAGRAVRGQTTYFVPRLDQLKDLETQKKLDGKSFPGMAQVCVDSITTIVADIGKLRSMSKMEWALASALKYQTAGLALCKYVGCKKWPLPMLPDAVPADKAERAAMVREFAATQIKARFEQNLADGLRHVESTKHRLSDVSDPYYTILAEDQIKAARSALVAAAVDYRLLHSKDSAKVNAALKTLNTLETQAAPLIAQAKLDHADILIEAQVIRGENCNLHTLKQAYRVNPNTRYKARVEELLAAAQATEDTRLDQRAKPCIESALSYTANFPSDAVASYRSAISYLRSATASPERDSLIEQCEAAIVPLQAAVIAKEAGRTAAWISGESDDRPAYSAGHFARIKGTEVETTGGARVPLEAAVRLAKIARRVIREGGKTWAAGAGPMVGHYRVNSVGVDGNCVIGCHTFSAEESNRMIELLHLAGDVSDQLEQAQSA
jgi:hypothetical protein